MNDDSIGFCLQDLYYHFSESVAEQFKIDFSISIANKIFPSIRPEIQVRIKEIYKCNKLFSDQKVLLIIDALLTDEKQSYLQICESYKDFDPEIQDVFKIDSYQSSRYGKKFEKLKKFFQVWFYEYSGWTTEIDKSLLLKKNYKNLVETVANDFYYYITDIKNVL